MVPRHGRFLLIFLLSVSPFPGRVAAQESLCGAERAKLIDQMMFHLGFDPSYKVSMVKEGRILHTAMPEFEQLPEDLVVTGAMLVIRRPMQEVVEAFLDEETLHQGQGVVQHQNIPAELADSGLATAFGGVNFVQTEGSEVEKLLEFKHGHQFNLSQEELNRFRAISSRDRAASEKVSSQYRTLMEERYKAYRQKGLRGIAPYVRKGGKIVSAAEELIAAVEAATFLRQYFPAFVTALLQYPQKQEGVTGHRYFWIKKTVEGRPVYVLCTHTLALQDSFSVAADMQFYVGHSYNALLTFIGAFDCNKDTLVVAVNHTFTEQVTGLGSSIKKKVGRKVVAEEMARQFEDLRTMLEAGN